MHEKIGNRTKWKSTIKFMEVVITCAHLHRHSLDCFLLEGPQLLVPLLHLYFLHLFPIHCSPEMHAWYEENSIRVVN